LKVNILEKTSNTLKIEVEETGHTICNLLQKELLQDENVEMAGYMMPHPLTPKAIVFIKTKEKAKPEKILEAAVKKIQNRNKEFRKILKKALK